jgi:hypothetical protein
MIRKFKYAIGLSIITGLGIIVAQSYWLVRTYEVKQVSFVRSASQAFGLTIFKMAIEKQFNLNKEKSIRDSDSVNSFFEKRELFEKKITG